MSSDLDAIIEAAAAAREYRLGSEDDPPDWAVLRALDDYQDLVQPEHVALMEAVVKATAEWQRRYREDTDKPVQPLIDACEAMEASTLALTAYRKEHGYGEGGLHE